MSPESPVYDPAASMPTAGGPATNMAAGSSAYGRVPEMPVFVGWEKGSKAAEKPASPHEAKLFGDAYKTMGTGKQKIELKPTQLLAAFDRFKRQDYLRFRNLLIAAGLVAETADAMTVRSAYASVISEVQDMQAGDVMMSPMALIKNLIRKNGLDPAKIGDAEDFTTAVKDQLKPSSQTSTSVYDLTPEDARATLEQAMAQKLGRAPTEEEIEDFISAAQTRAERNPTRVTERFMPGVEGGEGDQVTVQREGGEVVGTSVTNVEQGFDAEALGRMAERRAQNAPDYASYQAVSTLFPAFLEALQSTVE
jgi:hypothetical protein